MHSYTAFNFIGNANQLIVGYVANLENVKACLMISQTVNLYI